MSITGDLRKIKRSYSKIDGYLVGLKHGISLADIDRRYEAQLKEIEELRALLRREDGKTGG